MLRTERVRIAMGRRPTTPPAVPRGGPWPAAKRAIDIAGSAVLLLLLSPLLVSIAAAVRLDSRGPVLFRQARLGRRLEEFTVLKFRTMKFGAPPDMHREYVAKLAAGQVDEESLKKLTADPRVTRVGRFLRRFSLDELPQLVNVLRGEMSLVGPRPALEYELEHYEDRHFERFAVRPGMTGLWQVSGRNRLGFAQMLDLDVEYARTSSFLTDVRILVKTPIAAVSGAA
jgi:lipopolysaccharide/colanic/teichoic acid biosynthesis glycosyltransferase